MAKIKAKAANSRLARSMQRSRQRSRPGASTCACASLGASLSATLPPLRWLKEPSTGGDPGRGFLRRLRPHRHLGSAARRLRPHRLVLADSSSCSRRADPRGVQRAQLSSDHNSRRSRWCLYLSRSRRHRTTHAAHRNPRPGHPHPVSLGDKVCNAGERCSRAPGRTAVRLR
jgi:hypothetical protein